MKNIEKHKKRWFRNIKKMPNTEKHNLRKMHFLPVSRKAPTLSNAIRPYLKPWKNCKTGKNAFFAVLREGQTLGKIPKPGKMHFWLVSGRAPTLSNAIRPYPKPWTNGKTWKTAFFAGQKPRKIAKPGKMHFLLVCGRGPTLSNAIRPYPKPGKNCKTWKNAFFAGLREGQNLGKITHMEKCIFCCFVAPTLSNAIRPYRKPWKNCKTWKHVCFAGLQEGQNLGKIAKHGNMHFLLVCGRGPTLSNAIRPYPKPGKNCKTWKNAFFAGFREGPKAIQRYPSLSQTMEKMQNLEKCIFCGFRNAKK